jgi:hypothetical protein
VSEHTGFVIRAPKARSEQQLPAELGSRKSLDPVQDRQAAIASFGLEPAEFEALVERLLSCSTLRIVPGSPRRRRRCLRPQTLLWCRLGERAAADQGMVETRFE